MNNKTFLKIDIETDNVIINGICMNDGTLLCNLGYACDCCPYNYDPEVEERLQVGL
jgi:hypothetical protein